MKIIKSKKYANTFEGYDPYKVNWESEQKKAENMDTESLFYALKDAIEASQTSVNEGKYFDQASIYRRELEKRGISFVQQDEKLKTLPSLHTKPMTATPNNHSTPDTDYPELGNATLGAI